MATYTQQQLGIKAPSGGFQQGGWYDGRQYWDGTFSDPGVIHPSSNQQGAGQAVSNEVISQTNPSNVSYIEAQKLSQSVTPAYTQPYTMNTSSGIGAELERARQEMQNLLAQQSTQQQAGMADARARESEALTGIEGLTTPFREETATRLGEQYGLEGDIQTRLNLARQVESVYTEVNEAIRAQQSVSGLASIRNPTLQKTIDDGNARLGALNAAIAAMDGNIGLSTMMIDRAIGYITGDRQDRISYYNSILSLANRDIINLDDDAKRIATAQINLYQSELDNANATANLLKQYMMNPSTAALIGEAGVSLNDSPEVISQKISNATYVREQRTMANEMTMAGAVSITDPSSVPASQLRSYTDSRGQVHYYKVPGSGSGSTDRSIDELLQIFSTKTTSTATTSAPISTAPTFTPSGGVGTAWRDAAGVWWVYKANGWQKL